MSGRKATEVNGLLARGRDARNAGKANYENKFRAAEKILKENQARLDDIYIKLGNVSFEVDFASQTEFPRESEELEKQYQRIIKANTKMSYQSELAGLINKKKQLDTALDAADREGDRIRDRIRNKDWYCDAEYRDANHLLSRYQEIAREKDRTAASANALAQNSNQDVIRYNNLETQMEQLLESKKELKKRATEIIELRKRATEAKDYIKNTYKEIDVSLAKKFLPEEYQKLSQELKNFSALADEQVIQQITGMTEKISLFMNRLQKCYAEFLEAKARAEASLDGSRQLLSTDKNFYFEPVDYFKNKENATKYTLLEYLSEYSDKTEMVESIRQGMDSIEQLITEERFSKAEEQARNSVEKIEQAASYASVLQEHLIENFYVARDIKGVMTKMGFETGAVKLDGNIKNGWRITAKSPGGESIDFSQVLINDDGEVKIDINHQTMGSCASKWEDICKALDDAGIYIEKIDMVNGGNVLNKREKKQVSDVKNTIEQTRVIQ